MQYFDIILITNNNQRVRTIPLTHAVLPFVNLEAAYSTRRHFESRQTWTTWSGRATEDCRPPAVADNVNGQLVASRTVNAAVRQILQDEISSFGRLAPSVCVRARVCAWTVPVACDFLCDQSIGIIYL